MSCVIHWLPSRPLPRSCSAKPLKTLTSRWRRRIIDRQSAHLTRLVEDLLDLSRISRNKLELRTERTELGAVINAALETSRPVIEHFGQELTVSLSPAPVFINADVVRLSQVFTNLLNNGAKFTKRGGRITLTVEASEETVAVKISDTGIGISREHLTHIHEPFYQLDSALEKAQSGLGIGLTLVWQLVEMHGGAVTAYSEGLGHGSQFVVRLPLAEKQTRSLGVSRDTC